jgi:hypothetical protein
MLKTRFDLMKKLEYLFVVFIIFYLLNLMVLIVKPMGDENYIIEDVLSTLLTLPPVIFGYYAYKIHGAGNAQGKALLAITIASFMWFLAQIAWSVYEIFLDISAPTGSIADLIWIVGYPILAIGLIYVWKIISVSVGRNKLILLSALAIGITLVGVVFSSNIIYTDSTELEKIINISYIAGDFIIIFLIAAVLVHSFGSQMSKAWTILAIAMVLVVAADIFYANLGSEYETGNFLDTLYDLGYLLMGYAFLTYRTNIENVIRPSLTQNTQAQQKISGQ